MLNYKQVIFRDAQLRWLFVFFILVIYNQGELRHLDLRPIDMKYSETTTFVDVITMKHDLRTVGELYDFLREQRLSHIAEIL